METISKPVVVSLNQKIAVLLIEEDRLARSLVPTILRTDLVKALASQTSCFVVETLGVSTLIEAIERIKIFAEQGFEVFLFIVGSPSAARNASGWQRLQALIAAATIKLGAMIVVARNNDEIIDAKTNLLQTVKKRANVNAMALAISEIVLEQIDKRSTIEPKSETAP